MVEKNSIDIEQFGWMPIPQGLKDGLSTRPLSRRQFRNWTLVLQSRGIACQAHRLEHGWQLLVPSDDYRRAIEELRTYEEKNRNWPPPLPPQPPQQDNTIFTIWVLIGLGLFHILTTEASSLRGLTFIAWHELGNAHTGKILDGEWWRLITALTLHSGGIHLSSNLIVGGIFVNRLCRDLGSGVGWALVLTSGILGNLFNALAQNPAHRSIGASTAVFGAVGLLAVINTLRYRSNLRHRWPLPIAAALGLLALLGAGGENTDIGAHLFGFACGCGLGLLTYFSLPVSRPFNRWLGLLSLLVVAAAWGTAITVR